MNWDDIRIFLAIARHRNLRDAAVEANVSQPTAGRRLATLEEDLGVRLFEKGRAGHQLTDTGAALLPLAEQMENRALDLMRRGRDISEAYRGVVRIAASDWPAGFITSQAAAFHEALPHMRLELVPVAEEAPLGRRESDITVRHGLPENGDFLTRKLGEMACAVYGASSYVAAHPEALTEARYSACAWITYTEEQAHYQGMRWLAERRGKAVPQAQAARVAAIHDMAAGGAGLALLPVQRGDGDPRLRRVSEVIAELRADYWMIVHADAARQLCIRASMDWLAATFRAQEAVLLGGRPAVAAE